MIFRDRLGLRGWLSQVWRVSLKSVSPGINKAKPAGGFLSKQSGNGFSRMDALYGLAE
jgi:hypothetical protein